jgi:hypothetical protein
MYIHKHIKTYTHTHTYGESAERICDAYTSHIKTYTHTHTYGESAEHICDAYATHIRICVARIYVYAGDAYMCGRRRYIPHAFIYADTQTYIHTYIPRHESRSIQTSA